MRELEKQSQAEGAHDDLKSISSGRRAFLSGMAASCAGAVGATIAPASLLGLSDPAALSNSQPAAVMCGRARVIASDEATVVETNVGKIRGFQRNGVYIFKGVPYGASTSGAGRFMPPAKPEPWTGIRNALAYGRICPQEDSAHSEMDGKNLASHDEDAFLLHRGSAIWVPGEDCLRVNIWTPEINGSHRRPVMVNTCMAAVSPVDAATIFSPTKAKPLARNHDVGVVVNHNHRLNAYGYLNLAAIGGEHFCSVVRKCRNAGRSSRTRVGSYARRNVWRRSKQCDYLRSVRRRRQSCRADGNAGSEGSISSRHHPKRPVPEGALTRLLTAGSRIFAG